MGRRKHTEGFCFEITASVLERVNYDYSRGAKLRYLR